MPTFGLGKQEGSSGRGSPRDLHLFIYTTFMTASDNTPTARPLPQLKERKQPDACRPDAQALLREIYGYEDFRDLEIYDNLFRGKDTIQLSQGQLRKTWTTSC